MFRNPLCSELQCVFAAAPVEKPSSALIGRLSRSAKPFSTADPRAVIGLGGDIIWGIPTTQAGGAREVMDLHQSALDLVEVPGPRIPSQSLVTVWA